MNVSVRVIFEDRSGAIWVGTSRGLYRMGLAPTITWRLGRSSTGQLAPAPSLTYVVYADIGAWPCTRGVLAEKTADLRDLRGTNLTLSSLEIAQMARLLFHTALYTLLLVAVGLSSIGLTRIVGYCSMSDSTECCCGNDKNCELPTPLRGLSYTSVVNSCYSVRMVGGLNDMRAVSSPENVTKQSPLPFIVEFPPASGYDPVHQLAALIPLRSDHSPPPDSDIYTQTHSLLI